MKKQKEETCSSFDEMLMWTSYRYCIGRHTYVTDMAYDIAKRYYPILSDERKEFTARDIRNEIKSHLEFLPFGFKTDYIYTDTEFRPLESLFQFFIDNNVATKEDILKYNMIRFYYDYTDKQIHIEATQSDCPDRITRYLSDWDIDDLIPWAELASCFDVKNHVKVRLVNDEVVECFETYHHKTEPVPDNPQYVRSLPWQYEKIYKVVDDFINGQKYRYIPVENIKEIICEN